MAGVQGVLCGLPDSVAPSEAEQRLSAHAAAQWYILPYM